MFAIVNLGYFFLYGGGFALMKVTRSASSVACPVAVPGGQGVRPAGLLRGGRPARARTSPASGRGGRAASPTADPTSTRRPTAAAAETTVADAAQRRRHRRVAGPRAGDRRPPPPRAGGRSSPRCARPTTPSSGCGRSPAPSADDPRLLAVRLDLDDPDSIDGRRRQPSSTRSARPDGVVHNAGHRRRRLPRGDADGDVGADVLDQLLRPGPPHAGAAAGDARSRPGSHRDGLEPWVPSGACPAIGAYSAAKGALERWAESLSFEVAAVRSRRHGPRRRHASRPTSSS